MRRLKDSFLTTTHPLPRREREHISSELKPCDKPGCTSRRVVTQWVDPDGTTYEEEIHHKDACPALPAATSPVPRKKDV